MDTRQQRLSAEIEQTKRSLASGIRELKIELGELQRQVAIAAGAAAGLLMLLKIVGLVRRRRRRSES
jgi:hypothetical protein